MRRWMILLGRGGTVLIAVGLALLLVSLIPAAQIASFSENLTMYPKRFGIPYASFSGGILTPQQSLHVSFTANDTVNVYLLEIKIQTIYTWISEHYPGSIDFYNITYFDEFLEAYPQFIIWQNEINGTEIEFDYIPTKITNATIVFSNPSSNSVYINYEFSVANLVAPKSKVQTLAQWTIPIGLVLTLPWGINFLRTKTSRHSSRP